MSNIRITALILIIGVFVIVGCSGPDLSVSKDKLDFGAAETYKTFTLKNAGGGALNWHIKDDKEWISVKPFAGRTSKDSIMVVVNVDRSKLEPNKYQGTVAITSDGGDTTIAVTLVKLRNPVVELVTSMGNIKLELFPDVAPNHVKNFLSLAKSGFYDGLIFHRVIDGFMIQAGAFTADGQRKNAPTIPAEFNDSLHNEGTLAMARADDPNSAASQFYICLVPRHELDYKFTVFGKTIGGMDVVHAIGKVKTNKGEDRRPDLMPNQPLKPVTIKKINILVDYDPME
jgi:cyclophilin family peptidyl-prolyl cis-trans isomerase